MWNVNDEEKLRLGEQYEWSVDEQRMKVEGFGDVDLERRHFLKRMRFGWVVMPGLWLVLSRKPSLKDGGSADGRKEVVVRQMMFGIDPDLLPLKMQLLLQVQSSFARAVPTVPKKGRGQLDFVHDLDP